MYTTVGDVALPIEDTGEYTQALGQVIGPSIEEGAQVRYNEQLVLDFVQHVHLILQLLHLLGSIVRHESLGREVIQYHCKRLHLDHGSDGSLEA